MKEVVSHDERFITSIEEGLVTDISPIDEFADLLRDSGDIESVQLVVRGGRILKGDVIDFDSLQDTLKQLFPEEEIVDITPICQKLLDVGISVDDSDGSSYQDDVRDITIFASLPEARITLSAGSTVTNADTSQKVILDKDIDVVDLSDTFMYNIFQMLSPDESIVQQYNWLLLGGDDNLVLFSE